jgi:hypothetical protein
VTVLGTLREVLRRCGTDEHAATAAPPRIIATNAPEPPCEGGDGFAYYFERPINSVPLPGDGFPVLVISGRAR